MDDELKRFGEEKYSKAIDDTTHRRNVVMVTEFEMSLTRRDASIGTVTMARTDSLSPTFDKSHNLQSRSNTNSSIFIRLWKLCGANSIERTD